MNERELFIAALQIDDHQQRVAYVKQACGDDVVLFQRLLTLLQAYLEAGSYLDQPAVELQHTIAHHRQELPGGQIGPYRLLEPIGEGGDGHSLVGRANAPDPAASRDQADKSRHGQPPSAGPL